MLRRKRAKPHAASEIGPGDEFGFDARVDAILDDVRVEADRILEEARLRAAGAGESLEEGLVDRRRRLLELSDELIARAEGVLHLLDEASEARRSLDRMLRALSEAADEIAFEVSAASLGPRAEAPETPAAGYGAAEGDREAAIQMAAAGATRSQVDAHLREFSDTGDPTGLLDQVFGPATGDDARVPWAVRRDDG